jgi:hypothetical protein
MVKVITDRNYSDERLQGCYPRLTPLGEVEGARLYRGDEDFPLIPEEEWKERIEDMTERRAWAQDRYDDLNPRHKYQNGLGYCWTYSGGQSAEMLMAVQNRPYVELAPETLGGAVNWRNSGYYIDRALSYWAKHGMATREYIPDHEINPKRFKEGWEQNALLCVPTESIDFGYGDREYLWHVAVSMTLTGIFVPWIGLDWWRHAITYGKLVIDGGEVCPYTRNTHKRGDDRIIKGSRKHPDSLVCIRALNWRPQLAS